MTIDLSCGAPTRWELLELHTWAAVNHSAVPLHHKKPSISWPPGFVNTLTAQISTGKISVIFLITFFKHILTRTVFTVYDYTILLFTILLRVPCGVLVVVTSFIRITVLFVSWMYRKTHAYVTDTIHSPAYGFTLFHWSTSGNNVPKNKCSTVLKKDLKEKDMDVTSRFKLSKN